MLSELSMLSSSLSPSSIVSNCDAHSLLPPTVKQIYDALQTNDDKANLIVDGVDVNNIVTRIQGPLIFQPFEFWSEINFLGRVSHPNLVKLLVYCCDDVEFLLVYEFMPKGTLENHLFRRNTSAEPLSWERLKIAIGAARGLAFLHTLEKQIIYRDFKASNILLDEDYNAKILDFGLAKLGPSRGVSHMTTRIMGTYGYASPEYIATDLYNVLKAPRTHQERRW